MTVYPLALDDDTTIPRIDDGVTEVAAEHFNALREAVFELQKALGIDPAGSLDSVADRLNVAFQSNGSIKASALTSVGLASLPIVDNQVGSNAGIKEYKLDLDFSTSDLHTLIQSNSVLINALDTFASVTSSDLAAHVAGSQLLSDGSKARHVASHIDLNAVPSDARDSGFLWSGLKDKNGVARSATTVAQGLDQINTALTSHENAAATAHVATAITVDTSDFTEIPSTADTAQKVFDALDDIEVSNIGNHRATQHSAGIPPIARGQAFGLPDGYGQNVVPSTAVTTYLVHAPSTVPVDDLSVGDDIIKFTPTNPTSTFVFDSQFSQVRSGDIIRVNYGNGVEFMHMIDSVRYTPGSEWIVRVNGVNLYDSTTAIARIDRPTYDIDTTGILAVASANAGPIGSFNSFLNSLVVAHPNGASVLGLGFDAGQLDSTHYNLYLQLFPTGDPNDHVITLPAIDVTGNAGATPGKYTLDSIVHATNVAFRTIGYNYRFIAFAHKGEFGIALADAIGGAGFSIINGNNATGTLSTGAFTQNVVDGTATDDFDPLGLGTLGSNVASPAFISSFSDETAAQIPTKVIAPLKNRSYVVNGRRRTDFAATYMANSDGYWDGYISNRTQVGIFTIETTYTILEDLCAAKLKPGKTLVVQPTIDFDDSEYSDSDYGRFVIKSVNFVSGCGDGYEETQITVINSLHGVGSGVGFSSGPSLPVRIHFGEDSVSFNIENVIDTSPTATPYNRWHEVYVNDKGETFTHERARMPRQTEDASPSFLGTSNWHVRNVSPKLRGYRDSDPLVFNKYIRLCILSYDSTTGEFDGYLGQRPSSSSTNIINTGLVVTGRKNVPVKFYDETNADFIEVEFLDGASPGSAVLSTALPRFVDIELFSSLQENDELLYLASCEVNWPPVTGQPIVQELTDRRAFGSIDTSDLTQEALDYITSVPRELQENGVIRGLSFVSINTADNRELYFKGGSAIVNGKIVIANNGSVNIPLVYENGVSLPQDITWAVCLNEVGNLIPIIITDSKKTFFATPGSGNYALQSATFAELVDSRKDLLALYLVTATIASITITDDDVYDVRRVVKHASLSQALTVDYDGKNGNFQNFSALKNWLNHYSSNANLAARVLVKGNHIVDTDSIDLTELSCPIILEGNQGGFEVSIGKGLKLGSNVTLRDLYFNYEPEGLSYNAGDYVNTGNGCIYADPVTEASTILKDIVIERCVFNCETDDTQRPPFILIEMSKGDVAKNIEINNCKFSDTSTTDEQAAIAIVTLNDGSTNPAVLADSLIANNTCNGRQGIYCTSQTVASSPAREGLKTINVTIYNNAAGVIGYLASSAVHSTPSKFNGARRLDSLKIANNGCIFIGTLDYLGEFPNSPSYGTGNVLINGNFANWITCRVENSSSNNESSSLTVSENTLEAYDQSYLFSRFNVSSNDSSAIKAQVGSNSNNLMLRIKICDNNINIGRFGGTTYWYNRVIYTSHGMVTNNIIRGIGDNTSLPTAGVYLSQTTGSVPQTIITGNQFFRDSANSITGFIVSADVDSTSSGVITDNIFNSPFINVGNTTTTTIVNAPTSFIQERNKNQTGGIAITTNVGTYSSKVGSGLRNIGAHGSAQIFNTSNTVGRVDFVKDSGTGFGSEVTYTWRTSLAALLPKNTYIVEISSTINFTGDAVASGSIQAFLYNPLVATVVASSNSINLASLISGGSGTLTITSAEFSLDYDDYKWPMATLETSGISSYLDLEVVCAFVNADSPETRVSLGEFNISYRW